MKYIQAQHAPNDVILLASLLSCGVYVTGGEDLHYRRYFLVGTKVNIFFWYDERYGLKNQFEFMSQTPSEGGRTNTHDRAKMSRDKSVEQLAKDIKRRLLTDEYRLAYDDALERLEKINKDKNSKQATVDLLLSLGAVQSSYGDQPPFFRNDLKCLRVDYVAHDGSYVNLKIDNLSPSETAKVVEFVKALKS